MGSNLLENALSLVVTSKCERVTSPFCYTDPRDAALCPHLHLPLPEAQQVPAARQEELQSHSSSQVGDIWQIVI